MELHSRVCRVCSKEFTPRTKTQPRCIDCLCFRKCVCGRRVRINQLNCECGIELRKKKEKDGPKNNEKVLLRKAEVGRKKRGHPEEVFKGLEKAAEVAAGAGMLVFVQAFSVTEGRKIRKFSTVRNFEQERGLETAKELIYTTAYSQIKGKNTAETDIPISTIPSSPPSSVAASATSSSQLPISDSLSFYRAPSSTTSAPSIPPTVSNSSSILPAISSAAQYTSAPAIMEYSPALGSSAQYATLTPVNMYDESLSSTTSIQPPAPTSSLPGQRPGPLYGASYEVEAVIDEKTVSNKRGRKQKYYLIQWKGWPLDRENHWEPAKNLRGTLALKNYETTRQKKDT